MGIAGPLTLEISIIMTYKGCCGGEGQVLGSGSILMGWWAVQAAEAHELTHVAIHEYGFEDVANMVHQYAHVCRSKAKTGCLFNALQAYNKAVWARVAYENYSLDFDTY